ncbi:Uncharacterised protein [Mycobacteroides abscessus subsp. abscessus]|nr:Uncharacterised protein [Mycobacteroides abscessus subsp. abscessus]
MNSYITPLPEEKRLEILENIQDWFEENIVKNHVSNTKKLSKLSSFKVNPFLVNYISKYVYGDTNPNSLAKTLIYPRVMGTSINTSFGSNLQKFISEALETFGSTTPGIDIEFISRVDGKKKWCQLKAGPETINKDDINTVLNHFSAIRGLARTNNLQNFNPDTDCVVGILYGTKEELNAHYRNIDKSHPVLIGKDFWYHLTGCDNFYEQIIEKFEACAVNYKGNSVLEETIEKLAKDIAEKWESDS